jgi:hypothetical protein
MADDPKLKVVHPDGKHTPVFEVAKICGKPQRLAKGPSQTWRWAE